MPSSAESTRKQLLNCVVCAGAAFKICKVVITGSSHNHVGGSIVGCVDHPHARPPALMGCPLSHAERDNVAQHKAAQCQTSARLADWRIDFSARGSAAV